MTAENRLILVRHGASEWSNQGRYQGHQPVPLSSLGLEQVYALTKELRQYNPERIVSSDLQRARQTAEIIAKDLMLEIHYDARLRELDCGNWAGLTEKQIEVLDSKAVVELRSGRDIPRGSGERMADLIVRTCAALADWVNDNFSGILIFVAHAYVIREITQTLLGGNLPNNQLPSLGSYTLLNYKTGGKWILEGYGIVPNSSSSLTTVNWLPTF
ncbi:MAG: histidine phosphatase family protein [Pelatocladus maniniholoensis HA4357-MV3]|jgi:broad specificity phosphatase PhoE|uniref:Histidine phosphatase family protein n=1 Tax=Pelatocladus maniniholoensis HA4357-MV3 TaxID=1117104 RepID=A0A9E3HBB1_9NOST|nr:histidine phosphatase family protein [Pelatocladus maniniholoensis HA4357-MV3]BAZ70712.1 phosphoglycerate mutase family protein [Fischerella sp. NIES-4106]